MEEHALIHWPTLTVPRPIRAPLVRGSKENSHAVSSSILSAATVQTQFLSAVYAYVARRVSRREDAEDITAEVFAAAFARLSDLRRADDPFLWLLGIARRKIADTLRRKSRHREFLASEIVTGVPEQTGRSPQSHYEQEERHRWICTLVAALPELQREALLLQYVEELSIAQIAVVMRRSPAAVNSLLQRARATLYREGRAYFLNEEEV